MFSDHQRMNLFILTSVTRNGVEPFTQSSEDRDQNPLVRPLFLRYNDRSLYQKFCQRNFPMSKSITCGKCQGWELPLARPKASQRTLKARAKRGAEFLDKHKRNWAKRIDLKKLELSSNENCILGQLFNGLPFKGLDLLHIDINTNKPESYGFVTNAEEAFYLNKFWAKEIEARTQIKIKRYKRPERPIPKVKRIKK